MITATKTTSTLKEAQRLHSFGFSLFAVPEGRKCWPPKTGPRWKQYQTERASVAQLRDWFGNGKKLQPVVIFGPASGYLACRDYDRMDGYKCWEAANPVLAQTLPRVRTPRGMHVYHIDGTATGRIIEFDDGEYRGAGYCLLPPSTQPKGRYEWVVPIPEDGTIPEVDPVVAGFLQEGATIPQPTATNSERATDLGQGAGALTSGACDTEDTEDTEDTGGHMRTQRTHEIVNTSVSSVSHCLPSLVEIVDRTLPECQGHRHRRLFELARELKALPHLKDAPLTDLRPIVKQWHDKALPTIGTKPFEDTWFDFCDGWGRVKRAKGEGLADDLLARAIAAGVPKEAAHYERHELKLLVALCRELQRQSPGKPFFLSCRLAGEQLGVEHHTAARWLRGLQADGILLLVKEGHIAKRLATEYRYLAPLHDP